MVQAGSTPPVADRAAGAEGAGGAGANDAVAVARGSVANLFGSAVSAIANFALVVLVARQLSASAAGAFFGITSLFVIVETVGRLGSDTGAIYFVARWRALGSTERIRPGLRAAALPVLGVGVLAGALLALLAPQFAALVADGSTRVTVDLRLLAVLIPIAAGYDLALAATRGFGRMRASVLLEKTARPALQLALVALVLAIGRPGWLAAAWGLPYVAVAGAAVVALRRLTAPLPDGRPLPGVGGEFWRFALPRAIAGAAQIVLQRLDIVLVAALRGPRDAAIYTAATRFLVVGQFVTQSIAAPVQPRLSGALAAADTARARALYSLATTWTVLASWPIFAVAAVFAPTYLRAFGPSYVSDAAVVVVVVLAASMLVGSGVGPVDAVIAMAGRTGINLATTLIAVTMNVVVDVLLIPPYGIVGAAVGWCAAIVAANVVPLVVAWRTMGLHPFSAALVRAAGLTLATFGVLPLAGRLVGGTLLALLATVLGTALYVAVVWRARRSFDLAGLGRRGGGSGGRGRSGAETSVAA